MDKPRQWTDEEIVKGLAAEIVRLEQPEQPLLEMLFTPGEALMLAFTLQVACRHPQIGDTQRDVAAAFIEVVDAYLESHNAPFALEALRRGQHGPEAE